MTKKDETIINEQNAKEQLDMWYKSYRFHIEDLMDETRAVALQTERQLIRAIMDGWLSFEKKDKRVIVKQRLENECSFGQEVCYSEMNGGKKIEVGKHGTDNTSEIMIQTMATLSDVPEESKFCAELKTGDLSLVEKLALFFRLF